MPISIYPYATYSVSWNQENDKKGGDSTYVLYHFMTPTDYHIEMHKCSLNIWYKSYSFFAY